ncbi:MAG: MFS transporter [Pseudomonadota bacterium]
MTESPGRKLKRFMRVAPFTAYLIAISGWFFSFGLQTTLFPGVINYTLMETPERLGLAQAALTAPMLLLLPLAGVMAERHDRRTILTVFHLLAALAAAAMAALLFADRLAYLLLIGYALMVGLAGAFVMPARDSAINAVVDVNRRMGRTMTLQKGVIIASLVQFAAQIFGMGAGFLASLFGPAPLFTAQAIGLVMGAMAALALPRLHSRRTHHAGMVTSLSDGIRAVTSSTILFPMTLIMVAVGLLVVGGGFFVIVPVLVRDVYASGYEVLSTLLVAFWLGAFAANVLLARMREIARPGLALMLAQLVTVVSMGLLAAPLSLVWMYLLVFGWGLGAGVAITLSRAVVQENAPPDKIARVMSVYALGLFGGMPLGAVAMGFIVGDIGPRLSALIPMAGLLVVLAWIALFTPILQVRREPGA